METNFDESGDGGSGGDDRRSGGGDRGFGGRDRGSGGGGFRGPRRQGGGGFNRPREMHKATCAECKKECEVPFKPTEGRPVYCRDCFESKRERF